MNNKKKILVAALAVCLVAVMSMGTLAWFSDDDTVTNQFMVSDSNGGNLDADGIFSIDVWEYNDDSNTKRQGDANGIVTYEHIAPNGQYKKEIHAENTGAYDQYVRVNVTLTHATQWLVKFDSYNIANLDVIFEGHNENAWVRFENPSYDSANGGTLTYTYYLNSKLAAGATSPALFTHVRIPWQLTREDFVDIGSPFELQVIAEAVQFDNMPSSVTGHTTIAEQAQAAFALVNSGTAPVNP